MKSGIALRAATGTLFVVFAIAIVAAADPAPASILDGRTFIVNIGDKGRPADNIGDVVTFRDGRFRSDACAEWGYGWAPYRARQEADGIAFDVEIVNESDGKLVWHGRIRGATAEGTQTYYRKPGLFRPNPAATERWFKGTAK